jgi:hypothetical protein
MGKARPMRALRQSYKGVPNAYRFVRESTPFFLNVGVAGSHISLIAGTGSIPNISVLKSDKFSMDMLSAFETEFAPLFATFKLDKVELTMIPQWQIMNEGNLSVGADTSRTPNLMVTRINTKYLGQDVTLDSTAEGQRDALAQRQMKTRSLYGSKKWLKLTTHRPDVARAVPKDLAHTATVQALQASPWLPIQGGDKVQFALNDLCFFDSLSGEDILHIPYVYRCYWKAYFRVSQVG